MNLESSYIDFPANIYLFKINNWNIRNRCEICSKLTISVFIVNFEHISHLFLVLLLLTLNKWMLAGLCLWTSSYDILNKTFKFWLGILHIFQMCSLKSIFIVNCDFSQFPWETTWMSISSHTKLKNNFFWISLDFNTRQVSQNHFVRERNSK